MAYRESSKAILKRIMIEVKLYAITCMLEESENRNKKGRLFPRVASSRSIITIP
jgi:hypothetical protein